jgi:hypothetical protein
MSWDDIILLTVLNNYDCIVRLRGAIRIFRFSLSQEPSPATRCPTYTPNDLVFHRTNFIVVIPCQLLHGFDPPAHMHRERERESKRQSLCLYPVAIEDMHPETVSWSFVSLGLVAGKSQKFVLFMCA